ncbi:hypothetical protein [Alkalitalea saponilacus]|uniref:Uncharacterized protein n=1 Tax=Alkalitalea saponilacus TaxID=889453 RepID=A0A1T5HUE2_9BACT|nr:hypothetical protein [Alkalitalea saponilacus]ASB50478.1 hypothetical protein CDL62_15640 [Alkalitalea saponilacus]ASB50489.1 hypothetical protein CDL62_15700 [Alkalitalea saponilacus]SKC24288.1 hypothetical protein SAMN03080601_03587 [Alkalitalea saponilacus]
MNSIRKNNDIIITALLLIIAVFGLIKKLDYGVSIEIRNYIAYSVIIGIFILRLFHIQKTKLILALALIVGSFNLIQFTHSDIYISFSIEDLIFLGFQPVSFSALIGLILLDMKTVGTFFRNIISEKSEIEIERNKNQLIEVYKSKYKDYSKNKLQDIIDQPNLFQEAAVSAAKELINE